MRIRDTDFDTKIKDAMSEMPQFSQGFEEKLFASADLLLEKRRDLTLARTLRREQVKKTRASLIELLKDSWRTTLSSLEQFADFFSGRPLSQLMGALAVISLVVLVRSHQQRQTLSLSDLPEFPKTNNAPARYDAMYEAERNTYEKEVEDAHRESSGGI